ncbi:MAG: SDR family oxidoreductase [Antricoccus sp.]
MNTLEGRTALITGAGRGLGREHAIMFADLGAQVVVNDNGAGPDGSGDDASPAAEVVREIKARGGEATAHVGSVSDWNNAKEMIDLTVDTYGKLDILVNNAGILRDRMLVNMSESEFDSVIDVHLKGHFCPSRHAAAYWRDMAKAGTPIDAAIINTSSGSGLRGNPGQTNYAAAKAGIAAMTIIHARELERYGVRVNAIAPIARTRLTEATPGLGDRIGVDGSGSFDKWAPENISPLVAWLAMAHNKVSGQVFSVFGGHIGWQQGWTEREAYDLDRQWQIHEIAEALSDIPAGPPVFAGVAT